MKRSAFKTGDITTKGREVISKANKAAKLAKLSSMTAANSPWVKALANKTLGVAGMVLDPISMGTKDDVQAIKEQENEAYRNQKTHDGISLYKETTDMNQGGKVIFTKKTDEEIDNERLKITMENINRLNKKIKK